MVASVPKSVNYFELVLYTAHCSLVSQYFTTVLHCSECDKTDELFSNIKTMTDWRLVLQKVLIDKPFRESFRCEHGPKFQIIFNSILIIIMKLIWSSTNTHAEQQREKREMVWRNLETKSPKQRPANVRIILPWRVDAMLLACILTFHNVILIFFLILNLFSSLFNLNFLNTTLWNIQ